MGSLFLLGVIVFWDTYRVEQPAFNLIVSPKVFPYAIAFFLTLLSLILAIKIIKGDLHFALKDLRQLMFQHAEKYEFEEAANIKKKIELFSLVNKIS